VTRVDWYTLSGRSMWPLAAPWQAGVVRVPFEDLRRGDLVATLGVRPGEVWIHRVASLGQDELQTRGDTRATADTPIAASAVLGRVAQLRLGAVTLPVPASGLSGAAVRSAGLAWARVAPALRVGWGRLRRGVSRNS
jgi:hypothetical protein